MKKESRTLNTQTEGLVESVLTQQEQAGLTPESVMGLLAEGNKRYVNGEVTLRNHKRQMRRAVAHQYPMAIVLSCIDSRVPVESVFDQGIGDLFVARVAGNFVNTDILGCMEYACKLSGAKVILVLGHDHCGAVKGAIADVELGNLSTMLEKLKPAVNSFPGYEGEKSSSNAEFVRMVAEKNVLINVARIRQQSPILQAMETAGEIKITGAMYEIETGQVNFIEL